MRHPSLTVLVLVIAICLSRQARSQGFPPNTVIASCADVMCPSAPASVAAQCAVLNKTFTAIGQARIPIDTSTNGGSSSSTLAGLSWIEGVAVRDRPGIDRTYDKTFYLGTPPDLDLTGTGSCAVFFTEVSDGVSFGDGDPSTVQGTCQQAMSSDCVSALIGRAKAVNFQGLPIDDACKKLQGEFHVNLDPVCSRFATGSQWGGIVTARRLLFIWNLCHSDNGRVTDYYDSPLWPSGGQENYLSAEHYVQLLACPPKDGRPHVGTVLSD
jgi:hypothetical protein